MQKCEDPDLLMADIKSDDYPMLSSDFGSSVKSPEKPPIVE